ncbi:efflux RND transporter permease subunit [Thalassolituus sp.]|uniref:efflux RND transporter permease subunit n=1 Tax=Thalassolituus sp. TaxID=2030822 RepID=UPI003514CA83
MKLFALLDRYQRLVFAITSMLLLVGLASWFTMARQEDPSFPYRNAVVTAVFPGATATQIEKLLTEPLEERLAEVDEVDRIRSVSRDSVVVLILELHDHIYDTDAAWDRVQTALDRAEEDFPAGVTELTFENKKMDIPAVILSVTGSDDLVFMATQAQRLKRQLLRIPQVSRIELSGDPKEELRVEIDESALNELGINRAQIVQVIQNSNQVIPGGQIQLDGYNLRLVSGSDLSSPESLKSLPLTSSSGQLVPLGAVADIHVVPREPLGTLSYIDGERAVMLGIITRRGQVDALKFGEALRAEIATLKYDFYPLQIKEVFFQPEYVDSRLTGLQWNLAGSVAIIALVVVLALGLRNGLLVAAVLPVVAIISLAIYSLGGGVLHQIAVIGMVISLGILIDNAIVVVESIEQNLAVGLNRADAVKGTFAQMAMPLFSSTGTTIAAFIPLLLSKGATGDFTRGIPVMIILALIVSYLISVLVLPLVAQHLVVERRKTRGPFITRLTDFLVTASRDYSKRTLLIVGTLMLMAVSLVPGLKLQFFPLADRNQLVLDITLPSNSSIEESRDISTEIEQQLLNSDGIMSVYRTVGASGFRVYYNMLIQNEAPNTARLVLTTSDADVNASVIDWIEHELQSVYPQTMLVVKRLGQGPPTAAPVELRLQSDEPEALSLATDTVLRILHQTPGTDMIRSDLDTGMPEWRYRVDTTTANELGLTTSQVAQTLFSQSRGLSAGEYRYADDPIDIRVRSASGEDSSAAAVAGLTLTNPSGVQVPLAAVTEQNFAWSPAVIRHYQGIRTVTVLSELAPGAAYNEVLSALYEQLEVTPLPDSVTMQLGGDAEGSGEANTAILKIAPLGAMLLLVFMLIEFNSFRRLGIIMMTIPLAAVGIIPGLVISGSPFGFQSLLGVIALTGIVVNNAIVLLDAIDTRLHDGEPLRDAVDAAIRDRTAPVLLTTLTTVLGLLTLAFSASTLWPPMAWAIISGLLMSTLLTLLVIPVLCRRFLA